jgi:hypothetical protein
MDDVKEFSRVLVTKAAAVRRVKMAVNPALLGAGACGAPRGRSTCGAAVPRAA